MIEKMPEAYRLQKQLIKEFKPPADVQPRPQSKPTAPKQPVVEP